MQHIVDAHKSAQTFSMAAIPICESILDSIGTVFIGGLLYRWQFLSGIEDKVKT